VAFTRSSVVAPTLVLGALLFASPATPSGPHDLMPAPERLEWGEGRLPVDLRFTVASVGVTDPRVAAGIARALARLRAQTGLALKPPTGSRTASLLVAAAGRGEAIQGVGEDESYTLVVRPEGARLSSPNPLGVLRGLETFLQLVREEHGHFIVPTARIEDRPRFPWRGLLLDPSRRFEGIDVTKRTLDGMAAVKLNVLHWHLSDDQGFRVESRVYPRLQEKGSDGFFYTQEQVKDVLAYARERGIRVVPEFDMPGHATSWLAGYPELGSAPGPFSLVRAWGIFDFVLDPSREEVYAFLDRFLGEMAGLFPDAYFHIGGDEVTPREWNESRAVSDFLYSHDLADADDLQAHFNARVNLILSRHQKRMVGWDEVLSPELPKSIVIQSWRGPDALARAAGLGFDGILANGYYLDLMQKASFHYLNDPIPQKSTLSEEARRHILGGEACMWGEFVNPETIDSRIWPRAAAVAERLWSPADVRDVEDMYRRMEIESVRLDALGLQHRANYQPMLERLTGGRPVESLRVLADLVEPVKLYRRGEMRTYTTATPLDRLVDAARPESLAARRFGADLEARLAAGEGPHDDSALRTALTRWRDNHVVLEPILSASPLAAEARPLSRELAALGRLGLEALDSVESGKAPPSTWQEEAGRTLDRASKPKAEVELAVLASIRKLVLAAENIDTLKTLAPERWNPWLDDLITKKNAPPAS
jgi:hexosaminidase